MGRPGNRLDGQVRCAGPLADILEVQFHGEAGTVLLNRRQYKARYLVWTLSNQDDFHSLTVTFATNNHKHFLLLKQRYLHRWARLLSLLIDEQLLIASIILPIADFELPPIFTYFHFPFTNCGKQTEVCWLPLVPYFHYFRKIDTQTDRRTDRQTHWQSGRQTDTQTEKQADRWTGNNIQYREMNRKQYTLVNQKC